MGGGGGEEVHLKSKLGHRWGVQTQKIINGRGSIRKESTGGAGTNINFRTNSPCRASS